MNAVAARTSGLKQSFSAFWAERNKREQNMLIVAALVVVLGLFYALLIDPALSGRDDLQKRLPGLRQQAAEVQALAKQVSSMEGKASAPAPAVTRPSVEASLARKGLQAQDITVTGETVRLQLNDVSFTSLVGWLAEMQRSARLSVNEASVTALEQNDRVSATLSLRQQRTGQDS